MAQATRLEQFRIWIRRKLSDKEIAAMEGRSVWAVIKFRVRNRIFRRKKCPKKV